MLICFLLLTLVRGQSISSPQYVWSSLPNAPLAMGEVGAAVVGDLLFVMGWTDAAADKTKVNSFDLKAAQWRPVNATAPRLLPGDHHTIQVVGKKMFVLGGLRGSEGKVQIFDADLNKWSLGPDLPWAVGACSSAVIAGKIVVVGGTNEPTPINGCAILDPANLAAGWSACPALPSTGQHHMAGGTDGSRLFVWGGRGFSPLDFHARFDLAANQWTTPTAGKLPVGRAGMGVAAFLDGKFFVMGGEGGPNPAVQFHDRVDVFDPITNSWTVGPSLPTMRHGIAPAVWGGAIYVACGGSQQFAFAPTTTLFVLRPVATTTTPTTTTAAATTAAATSSQLQSLAPTTSLAPTLATSEAPVVSSSPTETTQDVTTTRAASTTSGAASLRFRVVALVALVVIF